MLKKLWGEIARHLNHEIYFGRKNYQALILFIY